MMMMEDWVRVLLLIACIVTWTPSFIHGFTDLSDTFALNEMYNSMSSPPQLSLWTPLGGDPCGDSWIGVNCSGSRVTAINLSGLQLSGTVGYLLTNLTSLTELDLSNNSLGGSIPNQLPPSVQRLNLANNQFTGNLPVSLSQITSLSYLNISQNQLIGKLGDVFQNLYSLSVLDLSFNTLSGPLLDSVSFLFGIESMYLQNNQFTGPIDALADLRLENLNVANNRFTGRIPEQLKGINLQTDGNLFNMTPAPAPAPAPGNPFSMVPAPSRHSSNPPVKRPASPNRHSNGVFTDDSEQSWIEGGAIAGIVIVLLVVGAIVAFCLVKKQRSRTQKPNEESFNLASTAPKESKAIQKSSSTGTEKLDIWASVNLQPPVVDRHKLFENNNSTRNHAVVPSSMKAYSIADLQMATGSFSVGNFIGEGTFGRVYHAEFDDGKDFAVKKIDSSVLPPETADYFTEIVSRISQLDHPNVTKLVGYCSEHGQHLLVYEFHKKGCLHDFLHPSDDHNKPLIWNSRVKIALGTARAIEYLHEVCSQSVVHKNIKSTNILLDSELNPYLSDSGLASFFLTANELLNQNEEGSGYRAPEVSMSSQYSLKSDVYSFGVVMLELLTGRKPFDSTRRRSEQSLVKWATPQLHEIDALCKMVDPTLDGLFPVKSLSRFADVIALCIQSEPKFRPPMSEVVQVLLMLVQRAKFSKRTVQRQFEDYM